MIRKSVFVFFFLVSASNEFVFTHVIENMHEMSSLRTSVEQRVVDFISIAGCTFEESNVRDDYYTYNLRTSTYLVASAVLTFKRTTSPAYYIMMKKQITNAR